MLSGTTHPWEWLLKVTLQQRSLNEHYEDMCQICVFPGVFPVRLHLEGFLPEGEQRIVVRQDVMHIDLWSWLQKTSVDGDGFPLRRKRTRHRYGNQKSSVDG